MLFEFIADEPVARLPRAKDGTPRLPDGVIFFSIEQAAARSGKSVDELRAVWTSTFDELFPGAREAITPTPATTAGAPAPADQRGPLRSTFPELIDDQLLDQFVTLCRERRLNPLIGQVRPKILVDSDGARRVELMMCIEAIRLIAHRTGLYAGCDADIFTYEQDGSVATAATTVFKFVGGHRCAFEGKVRWAEYAGIPSDKFDVSWREQMPHVFLGKCSEAAALRKAFPQELGRIYLPEEMEVAESRRAAARTRSVTPIDDADQRTRDDDSQLPDWERARASTE